MHAALISQNSRHVDRPARAPGPRYDSRVSEVDVWIARPSSTDDPALVAEYEGLLTDDERNRLRAFRFEKHRREYLVTRALVRTALSTYGSTPPAAWRFATNAYGRPAIDPPSALRFNLSNHPTMVVCAVVTGAEIGVDVEPLDRAGDILSVATTVFAPGELAELRALPRAMAREHAVSLWTLKEAYIKARGMGLALPLDAFAFSFDGPGAPRIAFTRAIDDRPDRWAFRTLDVDGHRIAIAVERALGEPRIRLRPHVPLRG